MYREAATTGDFTNLEEYTSSWSASAAVSIADEPTHPLHQLFTLLPSGRRYRSKCALTSRMRDSLFPKPSDSWTVTTIDNKYTHTHISILNQSLHTTRLCKLHTKIYTMYAALPLMYLVPLVLLRFSFSGIHTCTLCSFVKSAFKCWISLFVLALLF